jgi:hypothetical protein
MAWTNPPTITPGSVISASSFGNVVRDDLLYLLARPKQAIIRNPGSDYTTTSTSFVAIDSTNLSISLTISGSAIWVYFNGVYRGTSTDVRLALDLNVNGARYAAGNADGIVQSIAPIGGNYPSPIGFGVLITGLAAGSHTLVPVWKVMVAGTAGLSAGGTATRNHPITFGAMEV